MPADSPSNVWLRKFSNASEFSWERVGIHPGREEGRALSVWISSEFLVLCLLKQKFLDM